VYTLPGGLPKLGSDGGADTGCLTTALNPGANTQASHPSSDFEGPIASGRGLAGALSVGPLGLGRTTAQSTPQNIHD
jgi:hypothetical protein